MNNSIGNNIKRFRLLNNMSLADLGKAIGVTSMAIKKYEDGIVIPDSKRLIEIANVFNINVYELIHVYKKPQISFSNFRKKSRLTGKKLEVLKSTIEIEIAKYIEVLELANIKTRKLKKYTYNGNIEEIIEKFQKDNCLNPSFPISNMTTLLENLGIYIIEIDNEQHIFDDFDGLAESIAGYNFIIILKINDGARKRFTLAHELGHLILNIAEEYNSDDICNSFAGALLLPKQAMIHCFGRKRDKIHFLELESAKNKFLMSYKSIIYRLQQLEIISEYFARTCYIDLNKLFGSKYDPNPIRREETNYFEVLVYKLEVEGIISESKRKELLNEYNNI